MLTMQIRSNEFVFRVIKSDVINQFQYRKCPYGSGQGHEGHSIIGLSSITKRSDSGFLSWYPDSSSKCSLAPR